MKKSTAGYIRLGVLLFAIINQTLVTMGYSPLPFEDKEVEIALTSIFNAGAALFAWHYNNPTTKEGKRKEGEI